MFTPTCGNEPILRSYFLDGWFNHKLEWLCQVYWQVILDYERLFEGDKIHHRIWNMFFSNLFVPSIAKLIWDDIIFCSK